MKLLIKLGGTLLDDPQLRARIAAETAAAVEGLPAVVVHGGGKQMNRFLAERGIESRFVNGLRVTTPEILDGVLKVFAGSVNGEAVAAFCAAGARAVGLTGMDAFLAEAEQLDPALGQVGRPVRTNPQLLELLSSHGYLPVVACVAGHRSGRFFNVNADQMAVACASAFGAEKLFFLTDVEGVRGTDGATCRRLTPAECRNLIDTGVATGGMQAKLEAAMHAVGQRVPEVVIAPGAAPNIVANLLEGACAGTRIRL